MSDIPKVAFNNNIQQAVLTNGRSVSNSSDIFSNDTAHGFVMKVDSFGGASVELKSNSPSAMSMIIGSHRYDLSGQTVDFNYDLQGHNGVVFSSIKSGSFINNKESLYLDLPPHNLAIPSSTNQITGVFNNIKKVVWSGNQFVAITVNTGVYYTSQDGSTWSIHSGPAGFYNDVKAIDNKIVICGNSGLFAYFDGTVWTSSNISASNMNGVSTNLLSFIIVGDNNEIWKTTDLINFTALTSPSVALTSLKAVDNSQFAYIIRSQTETYVSFDDGGTWTIGFTTTGLDIINDSIVRDGVYYITGSNGMVQKTLDYVNFINIDTGVSDVLSIVVTNSEIMIVDSNGSILKSLDDGVTWSQLPYSVQLGTPIDLASNGIDFVISTTSNIEVFFISYRYKLLISGLTSNSDFVIPELFIGDYLSVGFVDYGVDPKSLRSGIKKFNSENGRIFESVLYKRLELSFSISVVENNIANDIDIFRDVIYNTRKPIWFMFRSDSDPLATYLMKVSGNIDLRIQSPVHKSTNIKFIEFI